eukprot:scaffold73351_cov48-Phaeocystis_antarctica.AAC.2
MRPEIPAGRGVAATQAACTGGGLDPRFGVQGTRKAHVEHGVHVRDLGRVKAQRLVERIRGLPSRKEGIRCGARGGPGGGWRGAAARQKWHARGEGLTEG